MTSNDGDRIRRIDRRTYLEIGGGLAAASTLALPGCTSEQPSDQDESDDGTTATGWLSTQVTDQPTDIDDFETCVVTIDGVWLGPRQDGSEGEETDGEETDGGNESDGEPTTGSDATENESTSESAVAGFQPEDPGDGGGPDGGNGTDGEESADGNETDAREEDDDASGEGRQYLAFDEPQTADLVQLQGDQTQLIDDSEVEVGSYQFLQIDVSGVEGVLVDGGEARVETPGNAPLKFNTAFDVRDATRTTFTADFAPVKRGNGSYLIRPVATGVEVSYSEVDDGSGTDGGEETSDGGNETSGGGNETSDGGNETTGDE